MSTTTDPEISQFFASVKALRIERDALVAPATEALRRLVVVCRGGSGQAYKVRALLFSLWNGKATALNETLALDWELKKDFTQVLLAFGHDKFFYDAMKAEFAAAGLFDWFTEEGGE